MLSMHLHTYRSIDMVAMDAAAESSLHHGFIVIERTTETDIFYIEIAKVRISNLRRMTCRTLQILTNVFGRGRITVTGETSG